MKTNKKSDQTAPVDNRIPKISKVEAPGKVKYGSYPIVGIGASAGGLEALEAFFKK